MIKFSRFAEIIICFTLAPVVSVLEDKHIMHCHHGYNIVTS